MDSLRMEELLKMGSIIKTEEIIRMGRMGKMDKMGRTGRTGRIIVITNSD